MNASTMTGLEAHSPGVDALPLETTFEPPEKVTFKHYRRIEGMEVPQTDDEYVYPIRDIKNWGLRPAAKGGVTVCMIERPEGVFVGVARCSEVDNFWRLRGRQISEGRARKALQLFLSSPETAEDDSPFLGRERNEMRYCDEATDSGHSSSHGLDSR